MKKDLGNRTLGQPRRFVARCPACMVVNSGATEVGDGTTHVPVPGDFSVCINCSCITRFADAADLHLRALVPGEWEEVSLEEQRLLLHLQHIVQLRIAIDEARRVSARQRGEG